MPLQNIQKNLLKTQEKVQWTPKDNQDELHIDKRKCKMPTSNLHGSGR